MDFLKEQTDAMEEPLKFGQIVQGVVTRIDSENIYVRLGNYIRGNVKKEYVGQIKIDPNPKWWVRIPNSRPEWRSSGGPESKAPRIVRQEIRQD